jgi:hypothetical protein
VGALSGISSPSSLVEKLRVVVSTNAGDMIRDSAPVQPSTPQLLQLQFLHHYSLAPPSPKMPIPLKLPMASTSILA